jgi:ketosteroid isomerase-like protein
VADASHDLISAFLSAMVTNDRDVLVQVLGEDVVWYTPPSTMPDYQGPHRGRDAALELIGGAGGILFVAGTQRVEIEHIVAEGEMAAAQFRQHARTSNGRDYDNLYTFFFRIRDGQIRDLWENLDTGYFYALFQMEPTWVLDGSDPG